jgi:large subunit ribosomal protein L10
MALTREEKENIVSDLKEKIASQKGSVFLSFSHLSADDLSHLRQEAKAKDCLFKVVKKTLLKLAFPKETELDKILEKKEGSVALMFGFQDEISPAKLAYNFTLDHPEAEIKGGWWQGKLQPAEEALALAKVPDYQTLVQQLVGVLQAPIANFARVLENNYKGLLTCLSQIKN